MNASPVRPLAAVVALLLVLGIVGLVTVEEEGGGTVLTTAAAATTASGSARMTMELSFEFGGQRTTMTADGLIDFANERSQMTTKSPIFPTPMELIVDGSTVYIKATFAPLAAQANGKQWLAFDGSAFGQFGAGMGGGSDPLAILRLLERRRIASNVRQEGTEQVRGTPTTRYTADLDVRELMESFPQAQVREVAEAFEHADTTMSVWIGDDGVVRRSAMTMKVDLEGTSTNTAITMELFDFGVPAGIAVPPADQVKPVGNALEL